MSRISACVFAGMPFMSWSGSYGIHGPIDDYTAPNGGALRRGGVHQDAEGRHAHAELPDAGVVLGINHRGVAEPAAVLAVAAGVGLEVPAEIQDRVVELRHLGVAEVRVRDQMFGGGIIVDGKEAILFMGEDKPTLVIWSNHLGLVQFAKDYFQHLWDSSEKTN